MGSPYMWISGGRTNHRFGTDDASLMSLNNTPTKRMSKGQHLVQFVEFATIGTEFSVTRDKFEAT